MALAALAAGCSAPATEPAPVRFADHHLHIRSAASAAYQDRLVAALGEPGGSEPAAALTADDAIQALDAAGVQLGVVLSNGYMFGAPDLEVDDEESLVRTENDYVAAEVARYPERLVGLCSFNPLRDWAPSEVARCGADDRIGGIKLHLANSDVDLRDPDHLAALGRVFASIEEAGLPIVVHMRTRASDYGAEDAQIFIDQVLSQAPTVPIQIAHMAGWGGYDEATDAALGAFVDALGDGRLDPQTVTFGLGAVVFDARAAGADTTMAARVRSNNEQLARRIREIGIQRVVYATDWPSWPPVSDPGTGIDANRRLIRTALPLTPEEIDRILGNVGPIFDPHG